MKLGFVTYQIGKDMDVPALIDVCQKTGFQGIELRTTHAHGVESTLSADERQAVRKQFEDGGVEIAGRPPPTWVSRFASKSTVVRPAAPTGCGPSWTTPITTMFTSAGIRDCVKSWTAPSTKPGDCSVT